MPTIETHELKVAKVSVTIEQLAKMFTDLDSNEMVLFFNEVSRIGQQEWKQTCGIGFMFYDVVNSDTLTLDARCDLACLAR